MKSFFLVLLACVLNYAAAQQNFVPIRVKNKFGLADLKGKVVLKPQFDELYIMGNNYFGYSNHQIVKDTVHWVGGRIEIRDKNLPETGVLHHKKKLISGQKYAIYTVIDDVILGSDSRAYIENAMLFNSHGEPFFSKDLDTFEIWNPIYDDQGNMTHKLLLAVFEDKTYEVAVYDVKTGKISERLLQNLNSLRTDGERYDTSLSLKYSNENNFYYEKYLSVKDGKYVLIDSPENHQYREEDYSDYDNVVPPPIMERAGEAPVEMIKSVGSPPPAVSPPVSRPKRPDYFALNAEKQLLINNEIWNNPQAYSFELIDDQQTQTEPVIITAKNGRKGLLHSDSATVSAHYDHLQYIMNQHGITIYDQRYFYYAGQKDHSGKMKYGIIAGDGRALVPLIYDSIQINMQESYWDTDDEKNKKIGFREPFTYDGKKKRILQFDSSGFLDSNKGFMVAWKNGKCGLIGMDHLIYLPLEYDRIFKNGYSFTRDSNYEMVDKFIVLEQNKRYGIIEFDGSR